MRRFLFLILMEDFSHLSDLTRKERRRIVLWKVHYEQRLKFEENFSKFKLIKKPKQQQYTPKILQRSMMMWWSKRTNWRTNWMLAWWWEEDLFKLMQKFKFMIVVKRKIWTNWEWRKALEEEFGAEKAEIKLRMKLLWYKDLRISK